MACPGNRMGLFYCPDIIELMAELIQEMPAPKQDANRRKRGRPVGSRNATGKARWFKARGIEPLHAAEILAHVADERKLWMRVLNSEDDRVALSALTFLVQMRDGRPAQQINVTSLGLQVNASQIESARAVVAEIMAAQGLTVQVTENKRDRPLMLLGDDGGKNGG